MGADWRDHSDKFGPFRLRIQKPEIVPDFVLHSAHRPLLLRSRFLRHLPPTKSTPRSPTAVMQSMLSQWENLRRQRLEIFNMGGGVQTLSYAQELAIQLAINENYLSRLAKTSFTLPEDASALFVSENFSRTYLAIFAEPDFLIFNQWERGQFQSQRNRPLWKNPIPNVILLNRVQLDQAIENIRLGRRFHLEMPPRPAGGGPSSQPNWADKDSAKPPSPAHENYQVPTQTTDARNPTVKPETEEESSWWDSVTDWADDMTVSDWVHGTLDVVGLIPGLGEVADGVNALIYLAEGNYTDAALSAAAMIPIAGSAAVAAKYAKKSGVTDAVAKSGKAVVNKIDPKHVGWGKGQIPCFAAGTPVLTPDGMTPIDQLVAGDRVYAWCSRSSERVVRTVTHRHQGSTDQWVEVGTETQRLRATARHPFWVDELQEWVVARDLKAGFNLLDSQGNQRLIESVSNVQLGQDQAHPTYNLTVDTLSNYFVGETPLLVHNTDLDEPGHRNYRLVDPKTGETVYHGRFGPGMRAKTEDRHSRPANKTKVTRIPPLKMKVDRGTRTYAEARRLEHERIIQGGTLKKNKPLANQINGMGPKKFKKYYPNGC